MNRIITIFVCTLLTLGTIRAQDAFYYCDGRPVQLKTDEHKISVRAAASEQIILPSAYTPVDTITAGNTCIRTYKCPTNGATSKTALANSTIARRIMPCYTNSTGLELTLTGYISVKLKAAADFHLLEEDAKQYGLDIVSQYECLPLWYLLVQQPDATDSPIDIANALFESNHYVSASPDFAYNGFEISYDPEVHQQWGLYNSEYKGFDISVSNAWNYATGKGVNVAVVDQGVDYKHFDLSSNMSYKTYTPTKGGIYIATKDSIYKPSQDSIKNDTIKEDWDKLNISHGTQCAGIIAAIRNNGYGISGVAPDSKIMNIRLHLQRYPTQVLEIVQDIKWATENGADIISCSWQCIEGDGIRYIIEKALNEGRGGKGCIIVKSAGNNGKEITFPGTVEGVIAVANMQQDGSLNKTSSHGENLFITAPGTDIRTTDSDYGCCTVTGTSYAAPHVAGVVALMLEIDSTLTYKEVREILAKTAKKIGDYEYDTNKEYGSWNEYYGYGLVDANNAVQMTLQRKEQKLNK